MCLAEDAQDGVKGGNWDFHRENVGAERRYPAHRAGTDTERSQGGKYSLAFNLPTSSAPRPAPWIWFSGRESQRIVIVLFTIARGRGGWTSCPGWARSMIFHPKWAATGTKSHSHLTPPGGTSCTEGKKKMLLDFCSSHGILFCQKKPKWKHVLGWSNAAGERYSTRSSETLEMLVFIPH